MGDRRDVGVPDLLVEQLLLGELSEARTAEVTRALEQAGDPRLAALRASDDTILERYPVSEQVVEIHRRALDTQGRQRRARRSVWLATSALAVAAAAAVALVAMGPWSAQRGGEVPGFLEGPDTTRIKGLEPTLEVYRQEGDAAIRLQDAEAARAGDLLQLSYVAAGYTHGVIYSVDGAGTVTLHHPERMEGSTALQPDGRTPLRKAYELDDAPRFERFVFVAAEQDLAAEAVLETLTPLDLEHLAEQPPETLPAGWEISVITLHKEGE